MARDVKAGEVLENAVRMAGFDPSVMGVPVNWRMLAAMAVNAGLAQIVAERFPQMRRVEYRRYRPTWNSQAAWRENQECYWGREYWRLESAETGAGAEEPGEGSA